MRTREEIVAMRTKVIEGLETLHPALSGDIKDSTLGKAGYIESLRLYTELLTRLDMIEWTLSDDPNYYCATPRPSQARGIMRYARAFKRKYPKGRPYVTADETGL